ncbi:MAG: hypothetical protein RLO81_15585 [Fulvivirga sp.]|uniref:hypothetical protein n=1 Tax=Fulvivirga sp. TaxID=1931237 RepID=UPI0032EC3DC0
MSKKRTRYLSYIEETPKHYSKLHKVAKNGVKKSLARAKKSGLYITYLKDGIIVREYPDGQITEVGRVEHESITVEIGTGAKLS